MNQRQAILNQQRALQAQLDEVDEMLSKFDVFEGKPARQGSTEATRSATTAGRTAADHQTSHGLTRGEILEKMGLKGNKSGEMSVSNALTALTKTQQLTRRDRKSIAA